MRRKNRWRVAMVLAASVAGCDVDEGLPAHQRIANADPERGRLLMTEFGCYACHRIPGIGQPSGTVGPPLAGFASRAYIAGNIPNRPDELVRWIRFPTDADPTTAMPDLGVVEAQARDMAAYLYGLR